jgi:hypothetical protein
VPKFLIEVPHEPDVLACAHVVRVFLTSGSHFLTNAEWGCMDGNHTAWLIVDVDSKDEARGVVPAAFRAEAKVTRLTHFKLEAIEETIRRHGGQPGR